jgi:outer membrane receptor protein involved in Fe transport
MRGCLPLAIACVLAVFARPARADGLADEADLQFQRGAQAYRRGDYETALEHFLASNRLVQNQNVVFNIGHAYQRLGRYPEAFRYFSEALASERDPEQAGRIQAALDVIRSHVAVLRVDTDPKGATLYLERKNLGARGTTPIVLGLSPGTHTLLIEQEGYWPQTANLAAMGAGEERSVKVSLRPIEGEVRIEAARGILVRTADADGPACAAPCTMRLPPGPRRLVLSASGFRTREVSVDVVASGSVSLRPHLEPLEGRLVVTTDEPLAQIEIDGRTAGFTPGVVALPVGTHRVRLSRKGYHAVEQSVRIRADVEQAINVVMPEEAAVTAVSRSRQNVAEAPSSVSIVSREELRAFHYPTVAEALRGVPGVYVWDDRSYATVGIRGASQLGSYGNRVLVLSDGQPLNDDWIGSSYVGYDGRVDLGDVERIEVVRGPGSVVYGNSAFSGVINLVTRPAASRPHVEVGVSTTGDGVARGRLRAEAPLGKSGGLWTSVGVARGAGRDFFFPEFAAGPSAGYSRGGDGFTAATLEGRATQGAFAAHWFWTAHEKDIPTGAYQTLLGDARTLQRDSRAAFELRAEPHLSPRVTWLSRAQLNFYRFHGAYARGASDGGLETDTYRGSWAGLEQRLELLPLPNLRVFVGGELQSHFQVDQLARNEQGRFLDQTGSNGHRFLVGAAYATVDARPSERWALHAGARLDSYSTFGSSMNPRFAAIYRPYPGGNIKLIGGQAFRAPSVYELYYNDGGVTQIQSPRLSPERIYSLELEYSHAVNPLLTLGASLFENYILDLVVSRGDGTSSDPLRYINSSVPLATFGGELSVRQELPHGAQISASYGLLLPRYLHHRGLDALFDVDRDPSFRDVANVPRHIVILKGWLPLVGETLRGASRLTLENGRYDRYEQASDPQQQRTRAVALWDLVLTGTALPARGAAPKIDFAVGVYNAFDYRFSLPVSAEFVQRTVPQSGRTFLLSADLGF